MRLIAPDVWLLRGFPPNAINVFLVGDVLIDAATKHAARRILRQLRGRTVRAHALTHADPDHQGASHAVCEALGIPLWCGEGDVVAMEQGKVLEAQPRHPLNRLFDFTSTGPAHPVARALREGDDVAGFTVLETPGHADGHVVFWREWDRVVIVGDLVTNINTGTGIPGLYEPKLLFTPDPARNRESVRRIAALEPAVVCFAHGRELRDMAKFQAFVAGLPR